MSDSQACFEDKCVHTVEESKASKTCDSAENTTGEIEASIETNITDKIDPEMDIKTEPTTSSDIEAGIEATDVFDLMSPKVDNKMEIDQDDDDDYTTKQRKAKIEEDWARIKEKNPFTCMTSRLN